MDQVYKIIDERGRIYIPKTVRESAGIGSGDVLELRAGRDRITLTKAKISIPDPPTVDDILELLETAPKSALFKAAAKLSVMLGGDISYQNKKK